VAVPLPPWGLVWPTGGVLGMAGRFFEVRVLCAEMDAEIGTEIGTEIMLY
jgi:hypothetical protein